MRIVRALREAGSIAATPNDRIGYGIPDLKAAFGKLLTEFATSSSTTNECKVSVNWTSKDVGAMKYEIERKAGVDTGYVGIASINGKLPAFALNNYSFTISSNSNSKIKTEPPGIVLY